MFLKLILLLTFVPVLELWTLFKFHDFLGAQLNSEAALFITFGLILSTGLVGAQLARSQGIKVIAEIQSNLNRGQMPGPALVDGMLILGGGALLLTPGIWTDLLGLSFLIPFSRNIYRLWLIRSFKNKVTFRANMYDMDLRKKASPFAGDLIIDVPSKPEVKPEHRPK